MFIFEVFSLIYLLLPHSTTETQPLLIRSEFFEDLLIVYLKKESNSIGCQVTSYEIDPKKSDKTG